MSSVPMRRCASSGDRPELGAVTQLVLAVGFVALVVAALGADLAVVLASRAQAQVAADAAALAPSRAALMSSNWVRPTTASSPIATNNTRRRGSNRASSTVAVPASVSPTNRLDPGDNRIE